MKAKHVRYDNLLVYLGAALNRVVNILFSSLLQSLFLKV